MIDSLKLPDGARELLFTNLTAMTDLTILPLPRITTGDTRSSSTDQQHAEQGCRRDDDGCNQPQQNRA